MGLLRSEAMKYGMLVMPSENAQKYMEVVGKKTNMQLEDMNTRDSRRPFTRHVQRLNEMERILRFLYEEVGKIPALDITKRKIEEFLENDSQYSLDDVEEQLLALNKRFTTFRENNIQLTEQRNKAFEEVQVLEVALRMLGKPQKNMRQRGAVALVESNLTAPLMDDAGDRRMTQLAGVIARDDEVRLARAIWRASRGNTWAEFDAIREPLFDARTGLPDFKSVFVVYFQSGSENSAMHQKLLKVCQGFNANMYQFPENAAAGQKRYNLQTQVLKDKDSAVDGFTKYLELEARDLVAPARPGGNSLMEDWRLFCIEQKSIYTQLNNCTGDALLRVNVWYPAAEEKDIMNTLSDAGKGDAQGATLLPERGLPKTKTPTYIRTNDYTAPWQDVVNTYGIPKYQEANPALLTVVTFPFIFGMMYGDVGHGGMLLCVGIFLVAKGESLKYSFTPGFEARYMVLSLGIFATFAGFMYNDFFSVGLQIFESGFKETVKGNGVYEPNERFYEKGPYPFGLDWAWVGASNELLFVNSMKMKLSVLFGVLQMTVGVLLKWSNAFYERNMVDFVFECIPQMIFMMCFFGWMDFMILYKWTHHIDNPPSVINSLICMAMHQQDDMPIYEGSVELSTTLMLWTVLAVPIMLFPKPFILLAQHKAKGKKGEDGNLLNAEEADEEGGHGGGHDDGHGGEFEFGEVFIHQIIETIEYVLGTVSHTASYLRVWALSLAHQQLSLVFFQKTLSMGLQMSYPSNGIALYFLFGAWFGVTVGVLLGMDVLECFLHTLRLHWVEFQSKFFKAEGQLFEPYSIPKLVAPGAED
jgi:V-type H+-transporting ATPase subunit a